MRIIKAIPCLIYFILLSISFSSMAGGYIEVREAYETASKDHQLKLNSCAE